MSKTVLKHFRVLTRSWINNAIQHPGDVVGIHVDPDTGLPPTHHSGALGPHLEEITDYEPKHSEEQQKAADEAAERHKEQLAKAEQREKDEEAAQSASDPEDLPEPQPAPEPEPQFAGIAAPPPPNPAPANPSRIA